MTDRLTLPELESYLWGAATLLRGLVDAGDYKQFIFPLLFYKRISDVWDEEHATALADTADEAYARAIADDGFAINAGEREVKKALCRTLFTYKLRQDGSYSRRPTDTFGSTTETVQPDLAACM